MIKTPPVVYMMLTEFNLRCAKFTQPNETIMIFNFYKLLDNPVMQCFASIRMPNINYTNQL